jgi:hypothetical protein
MGYCFKYFKLNYVNFSILARLNALFVSKFNNFIQKNNEI